MEEWRDVKYFEGLYEVSSFGRVRSLDRYINNSYGTLSLRKGKMLKPHKTARGHLMIVLTNEDGCSSNHSIGHLVAEAFIPNPNNYEYIDFKDGNKENLNLKNIYWCNREIHLNKDSRCKKIRDNLSKVILKCDLNGNILARYKGFNEAFLHNNQISRSGLTNNLLGRTKSYKGFIWKYLEEEI